MTPAPSGGEVALAPAARTALITVSCLVAFLVSIDPTMIAVANPRIADDLGATLGQTQWITSGFTISFCVLLVSGGMLSDRFGHVRTLRFGLGAFTLGAALAAAAPSPAILVVARMVEGAGGALMVPAAVTAFRSQFPRERHAAALGFWTACALGGSAVGPIAAGWVLDFASWRVIFVAIAAIGAASLLAALLTARVSHGAGDRTIELRPARNVVLALGIGTLVGGLIRAGSEGIGSPEVLALIAVGTLLLGGLGVVAVRELQGAEGGLHVNVLGGYLLVIVLSCMGVSGSIFLLSIFMQRVLGFDPLLAAVGLLPLLGVATLWSAVAGRLNVRFSPRPLMVVGLVALVVGLLALTRLEGTSGYAALWPSLVLLGFALSTLQPSILHALMSSVEPRRAGLISSSQLSANQLGGVIAVAVMGSLVAGTVGGQFQQRLAAAGLDVPVTVAMTDQLAQGVPPTASELPPGTDAAAVRDAGYAAFAAATVVAVQWAAVAAVVALAVTIALIVSSPRRRRRRAPPPAPALCSAPASSGGRRRSG